MGMSILVARVLALTYIAAGIAAVNGRIPGTQYLIRIIKYCVPGIPLMARNQAFPLLMAR